MDPPTKPVRFTVLERRRNKSIGNVRGRTATCRAKCDEPPTQGLAFALLERHHTEPVIARVPKPVAVCVHARGEALKPVATLWNAQQRD